MTRATMILMMTLYSLMWSTTASGAKPARRLELTVSADTVEVRGARPGGSVFLIGYEARSRGGSPVFRRVERQVEAGADGSARIGLPAQAAPHSFWVAFDLTTGAYGAATAAGRPLRELELGDRYFKRETNGQMKKLTARFDYVYTVAVRPGTGVWAGTTGDGGDGDEDAALNGSIVIGAGKLRALGATSSDLAEFRDGDVVAIFLPRQMGYLLTEVRK